MHEFLVREACAVVVGKPVGLETTITASNKQDLTINIT